MKPTTHKLRPITNIIEIYARPNGTHYHLRKDCPMLQGGDFERLKYTTIKPNDIKKRRLSPCDCAYDDFNPVNLKALYTAKLPEETFDTTI